MAAGQDQGQTRLQPSARGLRSPPSITSYRHAASFIDFWTRQRATSRTPTFQSWSAAGLWMRAKLFRQVPAHPLSRKLAAVNPLGSDQTDGRILRNCWSPFGLTTSDMNYNRRAVALTHIIQGFFRVPALSYHLCENNYRFDALQTNCFGINIKL